MGRISVGNAGCNAGFDNGLNGQKDTVFPFRPIWYEEEGLSGATWIHIKLPLSLFLSHVSPVLQTMPCAVIPAVIDIIAP